MSRSHIRVLSQLWQLFAGVRLTVFLLLLLCIDLLYAYLCVNGRSTIFEPMNQLGIRTWLSSYGLQNRVYTAWFFVLLLLLFVLTINVTVCTVHRLPPLLSRWRRQGGNRKNSFALCTHVMHLGMVLILVGYLTSYTTSRLYPSLTIVPGRVISVANTPLSLELLSLELPVYQGSRLESYSGRILRPRAQIRLQSGTERRTASLGFNDPVRFHGYCVFLKRFSPRGASGMPGRKYIVVDVRRDPGVFLYFSGIAFFVLGMIGYVFFRPVSRSVRTSL